MTLSDNPKDVARKFYDSYNEQNLHVSFERYVAADAQNHAMGGAYDRAGWLETDSSLFGAFADFSMTILDQIAEDDKVATRWMMKLTQRAEFFGVPSTGRTAVMTGTAVDRVSDGKIAEHWLDLDFAGFLQQLAPPQ